MTIQEFLREIEIISNSKPSSLSLDHNLAALVRWDSLAVIDFMAMADEKFGIAVSPVALSQCRTIKDLASLLSERISE